MNNFNFDKNTTDKLSSMLNNGNINELLSQIPPDTMKNLSALMNNNSNNNQQSNSNSNTSQSNNGFDFNNIDIDTMMKMKSVIEKMNSSSDPRSNLLQSLKPYLREEKRGKLDQYSKILNMTSIMEMNFS
ncbi:MAG: hypothetical protein BHW64_02145 [Candidatus Melainabacteria bacterium LEY3_CP_29_8]|nr:MAG: hypothetical protein BHW64_02145 [Candidatus Melainabacteria bacterium LEY3_CP_29_8]